MIDDISIRHLAALQAVAEEGSFGRAADRLGFTQSAISQQIAAFERAIGQPLFDRPGGPKQIELTPVGRLMLRHAGAILTRLETATDELEQLLAGNRGRLSIATFQSITVRVLPQVIGRLRDEQPAVDIRLTEAKLNEELIELVVDGAVDLAFVVGPVNDNRLIQTAVGGDPFVVIAPASWSPAAALTTEDLHARDLIGQTDDDGCQRQIVQHLWPSGSKPNFAFRSDDNAAVQAMVRVGMGAAVMPYLAIDPDDPEICVRNLAPPMPPRQILIVQRADRTIAPIADQFIAIAREVCAQIETARTVSTPAVSGARRAPRGGSGRRRPAATV